LEADEALITEDERREELAALKNESDIPIEELLKRYRHNKGGVLFCGFVR
jgi:E1A-binding protein p400